VTVDRDILPDAQDASVRPDQERCASNANDRLAVELLGAPDAVSLEHLMLLVRGEWNFQLVLCLEGVLCLHRIGRNAENAMASRVQPGVSARG
jgi:hypothetical protein